MKRNRLVFFVAIVLSAHASVASVDSWIDACERELDCLHGFVLMQHDRIVAEGSWKPFDTLRVPHGLYSHSKSFTATAVGFLVDDGLLDLDERVVGILTDKTPRHLTENLRQLRVRDLLTMNAGARRTDAEDDDVAGDWARALLGVAREDPPGTAFRYDSGATHLLACIVERKSGCGLMEFLGKRLFAPIGMKNPLSTVSPSGTACGGWGMSMTTRDLAKFGVFYLRQGRWCGRQLLSSEWVALATARQTWSGPIGVTGEDGSDWHQGYGFQFWRCRHGFYRADGANGQLTIVMPQYDAVLSVHAGLSDMQRELDLVWQHLLPALEKGVLPDRALEDRCAALSIRPVAGARTGDEGAVGRIFGFEDNGQGVRSVSLSRDEDGWLCRLTTRQGIQVIPVGFNRWRSGELVFFDCPYEQLGRIVGRQRVAASAAGHDGLFRMRILLLDMPQKIDFEFVVREREVSVKGTIVGIGGGDLKQSSRVGY